MVVDIFSSKGSHMPFSRMLPDVLKSWAFLLCILSFYAGSFFL